VVTVSAGSARRSSGERASRSDDARFDGDQAATRHTARLRHSSARTAKGSWAEKTDDELVEALTPYVLDCLSRTKPVRPTKGGYQSWSRGRRDAPSADTLSKRKTWGEWIKLVEERLLEAKKAA
jgi:hypothetical protein